MELNELKDKSAEGIEEIFSFITDQRDLFKDF